MWKHLEWIIAFCQLVCGDNGFRPSVGIGLFFALDESQGLTVNGKLINTYPFGKNLYNKYIQ